MEKFGKVLKIEEGYDIRMKKIADEMDLILSRIEKDLGMDVKTIPDGDMAGGLGREVLTLYERYNELKKEMAELEYKRESIDQFRKDAIK